MKTVSEVMSKSTSYSRLANIQALIPRSQSDSSSNSLATAMGKRQRRGSDWSDTTSILPPSSNEDEDDEKETHIVLRPLQLGNGDHLADVERNSLLYRRLSKNMAKSTSSKAETSSKDVSRSHSMKSAPKKVECKRRHRGSSIPSEVTSTGVKVQHRTVSNRSLPLPGDESEYTRLRNFSVTSRRVINRGDSFRSKSSTNVVGLLKQTAEEVATSVSPSDNNNDSVAIPKDSVQCTPTYKVLLVGAPEVGKSSLKNQFRTSEYICAYESSNEEDSDNVVTVILNSEEAQLEFEEEPLLEEMDSCTRIKDFQPDACIILYSVTSRRSYLRARQLLSQISAAEQKAAIILVGNKTDLARLRAVQTEEGRSLAKEKRCKFIEISVAINHQVDELLVGVLTQIRMKQKQAEKHKKRRDSENRKSFISAGSKASGVLKKILQRACLKSKSCDNLHVL